ncbi:Uncharacterized protein CLAVI_000710 [Candidatus Clavichlamydia salmonicola]|uniref:DUF502 domain-containing protein n=1 Tax=Candidatus Clavichlamydia salmonicola TaxID=469812 RepID=UPI001891E7B3|nr:DUF502 domain-containing protein [Candidatus Clavichlamydia salmonicola]MBF5051079.1 Uncharacterized protein [Candidatus Clavichlamydia salmonicola]
MKKHFITGLVLLMPLAITLSIFSFCLNILTQPFLGVTAKFFEGQPWYSENHTLCIFILQIFLLIGLFFATVLLGFLTRMMLFKSLLSLYDRILHKIPVIKTIYKTAQQIIKTLFVSHSDSFKQVVMVPFPFPSGRSLGLLTGVAPGMKETEDDDGNSCLSVFIPTAPNPTSGFLIMFPKKDLIFLDMKVEDAVKFIISCGVISKDTFPDS